MNWFINKLCRRNQQGKSTHIRRRRLCIEQLEAREVPSTAPTSVVAISTTQNELGEPVVYAIEGGNRSLWEYNSDFGQSGGSDWEEVSSAGFASIAAVTPVLDGSGVSNKPVVYGTLQSNGSLWENNPNLFDPTGTILNDNWQEVSPAAFSAISATVIGNSATDYEGDSRTILPVVFGILQSNGSLWENNPTFNATGVGLNTHWVEVSPGSFAAVSATSVVTQVGGQINSSFTPVVFATLTNGHTLWENNPTFVASGVTASVSTLNEQWEETSPASFSSISAASYNSVPIVFGVLGNGVWENDPAFLKAGITATSGTVQSQWSQISTSAFTSISAFKPSQTNGNPIVDGVESNGTAWQNQSPGVSYGSQLQGNWKEISTGDFTQVSASAGSSGNTEPVLFGVLPSGKLFEDFPASNSEWNSPTTWVELV